jgi:hypothetical protein
MISTASRLATHCRKEKTRNSNGLKRKAETLVEGEVLAKSCEVVLQSPEAVGVGSRLLRL